MNFLLTDDADQDLVLIWKYSFETWGDDQADQYYDKLIYCFEKIAAGQAHTRPFPSIHPLLRSHLCESHVVFYLDHSKPQIIAILHQKMDLIQHLKDRI